jgi:AraC-like DNA-binding protein
MTRAALPDLCRAREYLAAHFNERVSLTHAAAKAGFYFHRFVQTFQETPHEFVSRLRIDHAKKLLLAGNHSVTDICFEAGYESLGSFSARFHSLTGLSPAAFRRESRRVWNFGKTLAAVLHAGLLPAFFLGGRLRARSEKNSRRRSLMLNP